MFALRTVTPSPESCHELDAYWQALRSDPRLLLHASLYVWAAEIFGTGLVLDVGCEYGFGSALLAEANPGLRVLGCDIEFQALVFAQYVLQETDVSMHQAAASALPLANDSLSGVCLFNILHLVAEPLAVLQEAHRVLKSGQHTVVTLPLGDELPAAWRASSPADRLAELARYVFEKVDFPNAVEVRTTILPSGKRRLGPHAPILAAVCRKGA